MLQDYVIKSKTEYTSMRAVVVVIVWQLDLQIHMQSLHITTNVVSSNTTQFVSDLDRSVVFPEYSGSPTNKTDRHDITELLLKETLTTMTLTVTPNTSVRWATTTEGIQSREKHYKTYMYYVISVNKSVKNTHMIGVLDFTQ